MNINEMREKLIEACHHTDCEKCVLYGKTCNYEKYLLNDVYCMTDEKILEIYETYVHLKDNDQKTLGDLIGEFEIPEETKKLIEKRIKELDGKDDSNKPIFSRVPTEIIRCIERVREYGCRKYPEDSWKTVEPQRYWEAVLRHTMAAWKDYKAVDPESGLPHIWHIACNLAFIMEMEEKNERREDT